MTEQEWVASSEPEVMLEFLRRTPLFSKRKRRLFAVACCRRVWSLFSDERSKHAIDVAELFADGLVDDLALSSSKDAAAQSHILLSGSKFILHLAAVCTTSNIVPLLKIMMSTPVDNMLTPEKTKERKVAQAALLRDIVGRYPTHPVAIDPSWLSTTVVALGGGIYEERAWDRMPILADALMDAGCDHDEIIEHCKMEGVHTRGCWLIDALLGKS